MVCALHLFGALEKSLLNANVLLIPNGVNIFWVRKSSHCMPVALGIISPAVKNAALV